ncbi:SDR family oxidoreductase [Singulisphaera sp. Ch08]|uniref:SDR family oxidoreductase n=1 Tax=Singulisphaera sp. Ch08 TaxID=3120278 RepID=A0AAU7CAD8_9BACT
MLRGSRLEGRGCLIVGGTSGIGLASARRFLQEGARVVVSGHSDESTREALGALATLGPIHGVTADVTAPGAVEALFLEATDALGGRLDVLFHVAGVSGRRFGDGPLHECTAEGWDTVMDTNAKGLFLTNQAAVRLMLAQAIDDAGLRGTVLNMGSVLGWSPSPELFGTYAYAASKGAIRAMTMAAAARYARDRVRFNLIAPGLIDTPMATRAVGDPAIRDYLATKQPIAGGPGTPDDCAEAALYLCEPASRFVTGTVLTVDGGWCVSEGQHRSETNP